MKKKIRMYFIHKNIHSLDAALEYMNLDRNEYEYVWTEENPDYLFVNIFISKEK